MPASTPASSCKANRSSRRLRGRPGGSEDRAVSEALGQIIIFAILSMMMILSLVAFGSVERAVQAKAMDLGASSAAARVAGVMVQASVLAERVHTAAAPLSVTYRIDLPQQLEGRAYTVALQATTPERVWVNVSAMNIHESAGLYAAGQPATFRICSTAIPGGSLYVRFDLDPAGSGNYCVFLVSAP